MTDLYVASLYFTTCTLVTVGYGDIHPTNAYERIYSIILMCIGIFVFASLTSKIAKVIESQNPQENAFRQSMSDLDSYLNERNYPTFLKNQTKVLYIFVIIT